LRLTPGMPNESTLGLARSSANTGGWTDSLDSQSKAFTIIGCLLMNVGETKVAFIAARPMWNDTGIVLSAAHRYHFRADGEWIDWKVTCDANGYASINSVQRLCEPLRRSPSERWFVLIGSLDQARGSSFRIGTETNFSPDRTATLFCYANDAVLAYWNNHGAVRLSVSRVD
jgi:hypothetical protein